MPKIFISYRRADSRVSTERIHDRLVRAFGNDNVFLDVETGNIPAGSDFAQVLRDAVNQCDIVVVVIGNRWLNIRDDNNPHLPRLHNPDDFVRIEVETSLQSKKLVLPVLVEGASPIYGEQVGLLPDSLKGLANLQFTHIRGNPDFHGDASKLIQEIKRASSHTRSWWLIGITVVFTLLVAVGLLFSFGQGFLSQLSFTSTPANIETRAALTLVALVLPTATQTPNEQASIEAQVTELVKTATARGQATINAYTDTPSPSPQVSDIPTTPTATANQTATQDSFNTEIAIQTSAALALTADGLTQIAQLTANAPTNTPRPTDTATLTLSPPPTATPSQTITPTATPNLAATATANQNITATNNAFSTQAFQTAEANLATQNAAITQTFAVLPTVMPTLEASPTSQRIAQAISSMTNVRSAPNTNSDTLETVSPSEILFIVAENDDGTWLNVLLPSGIQGWIRSDLVITVETLENAVYRARNFRGTLNRDWIPYTYTFDDGVEMALVPKGCFIMGSTTEQLEYLFGLGEIPFFDNNEALAEQFCIEKPFWIDVTEVTQAQFRDLGGQRANRNTYIGDNLPVETITWFEAHDYCEEIRNGSLPTEAQWEYAARGIENWIFPWGNEFVEANVTYSPNLNRPTIHVNSHPSGASWVGAVDMAGNVWEWVNTIYGTDNNQDFDSSDVGESIFAYPYTENDGRELISDDEIYPRIVRGGSRADSPVLHRSANRAGNLPWNGHLYLGFRCARDIEN
jgi:formylglycine-generating enzyme required for sulfatase activity